VALSTQQTSEKESAMRKKGREAEMEGEEEIEGNLGLSYLFL